MAKEIRNTSKSTVSKQLDELMASGYQLKREKKYTEALRQLEKAVALIKDRKQRHVPQWLWLCASIAQIHHCRRRVDRAVEWLKECRPFADGNTPELNTVASWLWYLGRTGKGTAAEECVEMFHDILRKRKFAEEEFFDKPSERWTEDRSEYAGLLLRAVPGRDIFHERISQLMANPSMKNFINNGVDYVYEFQSSSSPGRHVLQIRNWTSIPRVLMAPEDVPETHALMFWRLSDSSKYLAYGISEGGADECTLKVRDVRTRRILGSVNRFVSKAES